MSNDSQKPLGTDSLSASIEQIAAVFGKVKEAIIGVDIYGNCTFANQKALGYLEVKTPSQVIGTSALQHISFDKDFTHTSVLGYMRILRDGIESNRSGYMLTQQGDIRDIQVWQQPLTSNGNYSGSIIGFEIKEGMAADIAPPDDSIDRYRLLVESTHVVLWEYDINSMLFTFVSPQAEVIFGYPVRLWYTKGFWEKNICDEDKKRVVNFIFHLTRGRSGSELEYKMVRADGALVHVRNYITAVFKEGVKTTLRGVFTDISEQKISKEKLRLSEILFDSTDAVVITDSQQVITQVNKAFTRITGYREDEVIGETPRVLSSGKQPQEFYMKMWEELKRNFHWQGELWNKRKNGEVYAEWLTITPVFDDNKKTCNYVGIFSDISEQKETEKEIEFRDTHDALTKLPNRAMLYRRLKYAIKDTRRTGGKGALFFLDLDEFKMINDSMGHGYGDQLLQQVSQRLKTCISEGDMLARIGGDEFAILVPSISHSKEQAENFLAVLSEGIKNAFSECFTISGKVLHISSSVGVAVFPEYNEEGSDVLRKADTAMFRAKEAGKNQVKSFTPDMHHRMERQLIIYNELSLAIKKNELSVHYQPLYDENENIITAEALVRWEHTVHGNISPSEFIPIAEQTGLIIPLGRFVIECVCRDINKWRKNSGFLLKRVDVNVSAQQFDHESFYDDFKALLFKYEIPPSQIGLELTEEFMVGDIDHIIDLFTQLKNFGTHFSIDDFGTGYSSLRYIKRLPIGNLKIDQSFVNDIPHDKNDCVMVNKIVAMARQMNLTVTAEGIETKEQKEFLQNISCDYYQGFLFSRPLNIDNFAKIIFKDIG